MNSIKILQGMQNYMGTSSQGWEVGKSLEIRRDKMAWTYGKVQQIHLKWKVIWSADVLKADTDRSPKWQELSGWGLSKPNQHITWTEKQRDFLATTVESLGPEEKQVCFSTRLAFQRFVNFQHEHAGIMVIKEYNIFHWIARKDHGEVT